MKGSMRRVDGSERGRSDDGGQPGNETKQRTRHVPSGTCSRAHVLWPIVLRVQQRQQKTRTHTRIQAAFQLFSMIFDGEFDVAVVLAGYKLT